MRAAVLLAVCLLCALPDDAVGVVVKTWWTLGPFPRAKTEYDADPAEAYGGIGVLDRTTAPPEGYISEFGPSGRVGWTKQSAGKDGVVHLQFNVEWNRIINELSDITAINFQAWAVGEFSVKKAGEYLISCTHLHNVELVTPSMRYTPARRPAFFMGDIYGHTLQGVSRRLEAGKHQLRSIVVGKASAKFRCEVNRAPGKAKASIKALAKPDIVGGKLFSNLVSVALSNPTTGWLEANVVPARTKRTPAHVQVLSGLAGPTTVRLAPGQTMSIGVELQLTSDGSRWGGLLHDPAEELEACIQFKLAVVLRQPPDGAGATPGPSAEDSAISVPVTLRCRHLRQSFLFSFQDHDGTVAVAAAIAPRQSCLLMDPEEHLPPTTACAVLLSHSGVGATPSSQADSHKYKVKESDRDYTFGFDRSWILAPERGGAHNWEGQGHLNALAALRALGHLSSSFDHEMAANTSLVVAAGHSRGGHGACVLATHLTDSTLALAMVSGWFDREYYGDANPAFTHDIQLGHIDPQLKAVIESSVAENRCDLSSENLQAMPALVRTGVEDKNVPPWHSRRFARTLATQGVDVAYSEVPGKEHWWWDTDKPNDGGVLFDPHMRAFYNRQLLGAGMQVPRLMPRAASFTVVSLNPATFHGVNGIRILQQNVPGRTSRIRVAVGSSQWLLNSSNVKRFSIGAVDGATAAPELPSAGIVVDGQEVPRASMGPLGGDTSALMVHFARSSVDRRWSVVTDHHYERNGRGPSNYGPMRQAFAKPWKVVVGGAVAMEAGTRGTTGTGDGARQAYQDNLDLAVYVANSHFASTGTAVQIVNDTTPVEGDVGHHYVLIGLEASHAWLAATMFKRRAPFTTQTDGLRLRGSACVFAGPGIGLVTLAPFAGERLALVLSGTDIDGMRAASFGMFASSQSLTRGVFSNMLPDFLLIRASEFRRKGYGGVLAAGYFDNDWEVSKPASRLECDD